MNAKTKSSPPTGTATSTNVVELEAALAAEKSAKAEAETKANRLADEKTAAETKISELEKTLDDERKAKIEADAKIEKLEKKISKKSETSGTASASKDDVERRSFTLITNAYVNGKIYSAGKTCELSEQEHKELDAEGAVTTTWS